MTSDDCSANGMAATTKWLHMRADQHLGEATKPIKGIEKILETGCRLASMATSTSAGAAEPDKDWGRQHPSLFLLDR
jgi:predicted ATPase